jgi:hypothetical protein
MLSGNQIKKIRWAERVAWMEEGKGAYKVLVGEPESKIHSEDLGIMNV